MQALEAHEVDGLEFFRSPLLDALGFVGHAFSTRRGGVSEGCYRSLNLGPARGEEPERVKENRRRFLDAAGLAPRWLAEVRQVHGIEVAEVGAAPSEDRIRADALMTDEPGVVVTVQTADCVPVLIADRKRRAVAAVHAGRRGTAAGILAEVVARMGERYGSAPEDLVAALGPAISGACYEVDEECLPPFRERYPDWREFCEPLREAKWLLDLPEAVRRQLSAAGVPGVNVGPAGHCTFSESLRFFSYRRDGPPTGRLMAAVGVF